jgi:putative chitinase
MFTVEQLKQMIPGNENAANWHDAMMRLLPSYEINTTRRIAAFIAQCAHESGNFRTLKENLNYKWESLRKVFPKYFPTDELAKQYAANPNKQQAIANRVYANRMNNGPEESGDGWKYAGKGLIQLTGKHNYQSFADSIDTPIEQVPEYLLTFEGAVQSACWFWETNGLNKWADAGDIEKVSKIINGGTHGMEDRIQRYNSALRILGSK